jgi:predicted amidohydrolase YtcJ
MFRSKWLHVAFVILAVVLLVSCDSQDDKNAWISESAQGTSLGVDTVLFNGVIYTVDGDFRVAEAIAIKDDKIIAVGSTEKLLSYIESATNKINLEGRAVIPGLIDAHAHLMGYAASLDRLDLVGTTSSADIADIVAAKAAELQPGEWITGRGWDQNDWEVKEFPTADMLDAAAPDNPVALTRIDGHASWANSAALRIAGITADTVNPDGGEIIRDADGNPTGVFIDRAMGLVGQHVPGTSPERLKELLKKAVDNLLAVGLTGMHDMGGSPDDVAMIKELVDAGEFPFRVYFNYSARLDSVYFSGSSERKSFDDLLAEGPQVYGDQQLIIRSVKTFADGALGSRGAAMVEPYSDRPESTGLLMSDEAALQELTERCIKAGFQVCTHAIGDLGNRITLNAYEKALEATGAQDARLRIEHAQILAPDDIPRFKELGVLPSMQPTHATSDLPWAVDRVGEERIKGGYAWRSLLDTGVIIPCGSDFPVELINPFHGIYSAVTRKHHDGTPPEGYFPDQKMTREEALKGFTIWAAYAGFMEDTIGSLEPDKKADLLVLDRDVMTVPEEEIFGTKVMIALVNGEFAHMQQVQ